MHTKLWTGAILAAACAAGCGEKVPWADSQQVVIFNNGTEIETLDPAVVTGVPEHRIFMGVYEGVTAHDPKTAEPVPGVAESWTTSPDGRTYTFKLRAGAKWQNGDPVTADDFRFAWWRVLAPQPASQYAYMLHDIVNAKAFSEGRIAESELPLHEDEACAKPNGQKLAVGEIVEVLKKVPEKFADDAPKEERDKETWLVSVGDKKGWILKKSLRGEAKYDGPAFAAVGIQVPDPTTLTVTLDGTKPYFLDILSHQTSMPVHRKSVEAKGDAAFKVGNFVGNGPFVLHEWKPRERMVLKKNPVYWEAAVVKLEWIVALPVDNLESAYSMYRAGEVDWLMAIPTTKIDEIKLQPDYYVNKYFGTYYYRINCTDRPHPADPSKKHPFTDVRVRRALNLALDKKTLCEKIAKGGQIPATGYVPPGVVGYDPFEGEAFDRDKAKALLAEAGYPDGKGFPKFEILYNTSESHKLFAEAVAGMWQENLGITVALANNEWKVYLDQTDRIDYDVARAGWIGDYMDPNTFMDMFVTDGGNNNTGWSNKEYDSLIDQARREADPKKRMALFRRAETILCIEELPIVPVYYYVNQGMKRSKIQGVYNNIRDLHPWKAISIAPGQ